MAPPAWAQQAGAIAGVVRDSAGLAIPGVTVETASPALIEKVRTVVTDGEGRYNIVDLRVGTYTVTFTLPGFSTVRREGVELGAGFTATINATLNVGAIAETVTVTGASPVVDVQTVRQQKTLTSVDLTTLPTGNVGLQTIAMMTPGFATGGTADVGGTRDTWSAQGSYQYYHGKMGTRASFDGFRNQYYIGAASGVGYITNSDTIEELQVELTGLGADAGSGSTSLNAIPRAGGNTFRLNFNGKFSNGDMQADNLNDQHKAFGLTPGKVVNIYRAAGTFGGPIMRDRLWFFGAIGRWGSRVTQPGAFFNALQGKSTVPGTPTLLYQKDESRPADNFDWYRTHSLRTTWQVTERNRIGWFGDIQKSCRCTTGFTGASAIESQAGWDWWPAGVVQGTWTAPLTNRLLLDAGASWQTTNWVNFTQPGVTRDDRSILEASTLFRYGAPAFIIAPIARTGRSAERFSVAYVTGTHNFRTGVTMEQAFNDESRQVNNSKTGDGLSYNFLFGRPISLLYIADPFLLEERMNMELGLFAQDAWTINRVTVNLGLRLDYLNMGYVGGDLPAGAYVPRRPFEGRNGNPEWTDINPRLGTSWDVLGNGRTAVKASIGRYNQLSRSDLARRFHPLNAAIYSAGRDWNDFTYPAGDPRNGNFIPDCDLKDFTLNGECGRISNENFGKFIPTATQFDDDIIKDNRDSLWDFTAEVQHEVVRGLSVSFGYNHNWDGNFQVIDNLAVGPADFDEFCVTIPNDPRLPNAGGTFCGLYDVKPQLFGVGVERITDSRKFSKDGKLGKQLRVWDGFTLSVDGRLPRRITIGGGLDVGRQVDDRCYTVDAPNQPTNLVAPGTVGATNLGPYCRIIIPWKGLLDLRLHGGIPLPAGFNASWNYRNTPGVNIRADYTVPRSAVQFVNPARTTASFTRSSVSVPLMAPGAIYGDRFTQLDLRLSRFFNLGGARLDASVDLYNALNSSSIQSEVGAYSVGPTSRWRRPVTLLDARLLQVAGSLSF
jgi:hypothetical protein